MINSTATPTPKPALTHTPRPPPSPLSKLATRDVTLRHRGAIPSSTKLHGKHVASIHAHPYFFPPFDFFLTSFFTVVPKGLTTGPTKLTIYIFKKKIQKFLGPFWGPWGSCPLFWNSPSPATYPHFFRRFDLFLTSFFKVPSSSTSTSSRYFTYVQSTNRG